MAKAILVRRQRSYIRDDVFVEIVMWRVPVPVRGSHHDVKYSLALIAAGECVLRYDNEAGKGDHRHRASDEFPYVYKDIDRLLADFRSDVEGWLNDNP